ncbi:MAG: Glyoxalase/bleomycin resistance protein/dioxygenase [Bacteroidetes bacterium]|nr:Glyoxalase/bleomycin resistance protein/dioxygenase [Bacteroidota bacterium]
MGAAITHFEINGIDFKRSKDFYASLFDWKIQEIPAINYGMVDTGVKMGINGGIGQLDPGKTPFVTFYVQVEDPQAYLDKAVSLGAKVIVPLTVVPDMVTYAVFSDPDGCIIGLAKGPQTPPKEKPKAKKATAKKRAKKVAKGKGKKKKSKK